MDEIKSKAKKIKKKKDFMRGLAAMYRISQKPALYLARKLGKGVGSSDFACNMMIPYSMALEEESNCYVTYDLHPKKAEDYNDWLYYSGGRDEGCCIVMQGPLRLKEDFTLETVRYYGRCFPGVRVIVSTWNGEDKRTVEKLRQEQNCIVVQTELPQSSGDGNINFQRISSLEGAKCAKKLDKKYVLKTRTDNRITMPGVLDNLVDLIERYPLVSTGKQKGRLVLFNAYLFFPFMESAMCYFGTTDDMITLFSDESRAVKKHNTYNANSFIAQGYTYREMFEKGNALTDFAKYFFGEVGEKIACEIDCWWDVLGKRSICLPLAYLRPIWVKYDYNHEQSDMVWLYRRKIMGAAGMDNSMIHFGMWNDMRQGTFNINANDFNFLLTQKMQ